MATFIHPELASAAVALALLPILIHLLSRRRYRREPWAAMLFLKRAHRRTRRRLRLENWLLLLLRTAAILLFGFAVARPVLSRAAVPRGIGTDRHDHVLILDDSASMNAAHRDGKTSFQDARDAALRWLESFGPTDGVTLVTTAVPPRALTEGFLHDRDMVRRLLTGLTGSHLRGDLAGALDAARAALDRSDAPSDCRRVHLFSDFTRADWDPPATPSPSSTAPTEADSAAAVALRRQAQAAYVELVNVGPDDRDNCAIAALSCDEALVNRSFPLRFSAQVANWGNQPARDLQLEIGLDGRSVRTLPVESIEPGAVRRVAFRVLLDRPGSHVVSARLGPAAAALDAASRYCSVEIPEARSVVLVDGRAGASVGEAYYLQHALAPRDVAGAAPSFEPLVIAESDLAATILVETSVVVLANVAHLPAAQWKRLATLVRDGGGLLIALGDQAEAEQLNAAGADVLPVDLERIATVEQPAARLPSDRPLTLRLDDRLHPLLADFEAEPVGGLLSAEFARYWKVRPRADARCILRFQDGSPALTERAVGHGRVLLWTAGLNMTWSNLPAKPDFVPLVLNMIACLSPRPDLQCNAVFGETVVVNAAGLRNTAQAIIRSRDGHEAPRPLETIDGRLAARLPSPSEIIDAPGPYELILGDRTRRVCFNADVTECDLRPWDEQPLLHALGNRVEYRPTSEGAPTRVAPGRGAEISASLLGFLFGVVLAETVLAAWFGHRR